MTSDNINYFGNTASPYTTLIAVLATATDSVSNVQWSVSRLNPHTVDVFFVIRKLSGYYFVKTFNRLFFL